MRQLLPVPAPGSVTTDQLDLVALYGRLVALEPGRPAVRVNMISSVDGAASAGGLSGSLGGPTDKLVFAALRSVADVILVGSATLKAERYRPVRLGDQARRRRLEAGLTAVPPIAVLTAACRLDWTSPFFTEAEARPLLITVAASDPTARKRAAEAGDVVIAGQDRVDLDAALRALAERGFANVLAEGGPSIVGQIAASGHLDELCLTLSPQLIGGGATRIMTGVELDPPFGLDIASLVEDQGFLFLRYRRRGVEPGGAGTEAARPSAG